MCIWRAERRDSQHWPSVHWAPESLCTAVGDRMRLAWGDRGSGFLPLLHLPAWFPLFAQVRCCLIAPISKQTVLSMLLTFTVKNEPGCSYWDILYRLTWSAKENLKTGQNFQEVWRNTGQLRMMGACISPWNKHPHKPLHPKEAIKILMVPQETLDLAWLCLYTTLHKWLLQDWFSDKPEMKGTRHRQAQLLLFLVCKREVGVVKWPAKFMVSQTQVSWLSIKKILFSLHHTGPLTCTTWVCVG